VNNVYSRGVGYIFGLRIGMEAAAAPCSGSDSASCGRREGRERIRIATSERENACMLLPAADSERETGWAAGRPAQLERHRGEESLFC
jgi:hypothetical protein